LGGNKAGKNPTDRGQSGAKRSVLTEGGGVPLGLAGEGAHRNDVKMVRETSERMPVKRPAPTPARPQGRCLDQGQAYAEVRELRAACGFTAHLRARGEEAKALKQDAGFRARRWGVERTHRWMTRFRRVLLRWDKTVCNYLGLLPLVCAYITYRQAGLWG
jgi:putative transposase